MSYEIPDDLRYLESHEWVDPSSGRVGVTDFAQDELGDVVFVDLPRVGDGVERGEEFGIIESIKAVSDLFSPATGEVVDVNDDVNQTPEVVNDDPYGDGWLIEVDDPGDIDDLLTAEEYREEIM